MTGVHVAEFLQQTRSGSLWPVVLLCPADKPPFNREPFEPVLADEAVRAVIEAAVPPGMEDITCQTFHADETHLGQVLEEASTYPFLAERRVVIVRAAEAYRDLPAAKTSPLNLLTAYLEQPCETTLLVMVAAAVDRRKRFWKTCAEKSVCLVECPQLADAELRRWIAERAAARGRRLSADAVSEVIERAGNRLNDVDNALNILFAHAGSEKAALTDADVRAACADVAEETVWTLTDASAESDADKALHALHQLLAMNKAPEEILGTVNWLLESAYRALPETAAPAPKPFVKKKVEPLAAVLGLEKLQAAMALCTRTNFMMRDSGISRDLAMEMLVIKLVQGAAVRRAAARRPR